MGKTSPFLIQNVNLVHFFVKTQKFCFKTPCIEYGINSECIGGTCINNIGAFDCLCSGDEPAIPSNSLPTSSNLFNSYSQFPLYCPKAVNPCENGAAICPEFTICNSYNLTEYFCECEPGLKTALTEEDAINSCEDINECEAQGSDNICSNLPNSVCNNTFQSFECVCLPGFEMEFDDSERVCVKIDFCKVGVTGESSPCDPVNSKCFDVGTGFECVCIVGFQKIDNVCVDINECTEDGSLCSGNRKCVNRFGGYDCKCEDGYSLDSEGLTGSCVDIDECGLEGTVCPDNSICVNEEGGHRCVCAKGYTDKNVNLEKSMDLDYRVFFYKIRVKKGHTMVSGISGVNKIIFGHFLDNFAKPPGMLLGAA